MYIVCVISYHTSNEWIETLRVNSYLKPMKHSDVLISESFLPRLDVGNLQIATNCPDKPIFWKTFIPCPGNRRFDDISLVTANTPDVIECFKRSDGKFERGKKTKKKEKKMKCKQNWRNSFVRSIFKKKKNRRYPIHVFFTFNQSKYQKNPSYFSNLWFLAFQEFPFSRDNRIYIFMN